MRFFSSARDFDGLDGAVFRSAEQAARAARERFAGPAASRPRRRARPRSSGAAGPERGARYLACTPRGCASSPPRTRRARIRRSSGLPRIEVVLITSFGSRGAHLGDDPRLLGGVLQPGIAVLHHEAVAAGAEIDARVGRRRRRQPGLTCEAAGFDGKPSITATSFWTFSPLRTLTNR